MSHQRRQPQHSSHANAASETVGLIGNSNGHHSNGSASRNHDNDDNAQKKYKPHNAHQSHSHKSVVVAFVLGVCFMAALTFHSQDMAKCWNILERGGGDMQSLSSLDSNDEDGMETTSNRHHEAPPFPATANKKSSSPKKATTTNQVNVDEWNWFQGDVNEYYNKLEKDIKDRDPTKIHKYAVHRWMGTDGTTNHHYELILESIAKHTGTVRKNGLQQLRVLDAGCGLGSAMMWFEQLKLNWDLTGRTLSEEQSKFIEQKLPKHNFKVELKSYDDLNDNPQPFDVIYSIEAMIHSYDIKKTLQAWANNLHPEHGSLVVIDDFLMPGFDPNDDPEFDIFKRGWMANSFVTVTELNTIARSFGMFLVESRDLLAEYRIVELNYKNSIPKLSPEGTRNHQGWIGSKMRHKLTVEGKIGYSMVVFQKIGSQKPSIQSLIAAASTSTTSKAVEAPKSRLERTNIGNDASCQALPIADHAVSPGAFQPIVPKKECISSWYCCDQAKAILDSMEARRTSTFGFLKLDRSLFGNYMEAFAKHLNQFYESLPAEYLNKKSGKFLDIGATGSTQSGMTQVTTKFQHFAGPLQYWMLDSDTGAQSLERTIYCDVCDCPQAETCGFDVTFSHTVLEHASRPEQAFDTVARLTKKGGITMHLVPWSYQYHATPDDYYRFSHSALKTIMEDRGFEVLEVGYDLCNKPPKAQTWVDEHYDVIWLSYVIARKK